MNDTSKVGIKEQIQSATSPAEIQSLLTRVKTFKMAHPSTIRKCEREAEKRLVTLTEAKKLKP